MYLKLYFMIGPILLTNGTGTCSKPLDRSLSEKSGSKGSFAGSVSRVTARWNEKLCMDRLVHLDRES